VPLQRKAANLVSRPLITRTWSSRTDSPLVSLIFCSVYKTPAASFDRPSGLAYILTMATMPDEKRELELVEKVEFKILAVANNEQKLNELLKKFFAPLLLKAESPHAQVRSKVSFPGR
jgi:hypothetical protein